MERFFDQVGEDLFSIGNAIAKNQKIARLLKYSDKDPLSADKPDVDGYSLINGNISFIPTTKDDETVTESTLIILFDRFWQNNDNKDYKLMRVRFNVICPMRSWIINDKALRPLMIMSEVDKIMNGARLAGIGTLEFEGADRIVISEFLAGYVIDYVCDAFN